MLDVKLLEKAIAEKDHTKLSQLIKDYNLNIVNGKITCDKSTLTKYQEYWDKKQLVTKISLNSVYGILLQVNCRFFDKRFGQSITLTGRQIVKHMCSKVNETITGEYNYVGKSIIYGDTDSSYFTAYPSWKDDIKAGVIPWDKDTIIALYDHIGEQVNDSFPQFMKDAFNCPLDRGGIIKAGREIVGSKGLFITKKRYAIMYYDKEGKRTDINGKPGKIKAMGLDLKRSDTPKYAQEFLTKILEKVLTVGNENDILEDITKFRLEFKAKPGWEKGSPKRVNNLGNFTAMYAADVKANLPGHVKASINWNMLKRINKDLNSMEIIDGAKVIVCKLLPNMFGFTSIAYPVDEPHLPEWFTELPFDHDAMEDIIIDSKLENLVGVLNYNINSTTRANHYENFFDNDSIIIDAKPIVKKKDKPVLELTDIFETEVVAPTVKKKTTPKKKAVTQFGKLFD